jgi:hypothetical protein
MKNNIFYSKKKFQKQVFFVEIKKKITCKIFSKKKINIRH